MKIEIHELIQDIILTNSIQLILFLILISSFYFYYITREEEYAQISLIKSLVGLDNKINDNYIITDIINSIIINYPEIVDKLKEKSDELEKNRYNKNIIYKKRTYYSIIIILLFLVIINIIIKIYYKSQYNVYFYKILISNILSIIIIGFPMRYIFFTNIVKKYKRMDNTTLLYLILKEYQSKITK